MEAQVSVSKKKKRKLNFIHHGVKKNIVLPIQGARERATLNVFTDPCMNPVVLLRKFSSIVSAANGQICGSHSFFPLCTTHGHGKQHMRLNVWPVIDRPPEDLEGQNMCR